MNRLIVIVSIALMGFAPAHSGNPMVSFLKEYLEVKYAERDFNEFLYVAAKRQRMYLISGDEIRETYIISTAKNGLGNKRGSFQTPKGLHRIAEKVGDSLAINTIISQKVSTSQLATINTSAKSDNQDLITTRVLHLSGTEAGINKGEGCDSYSRGIFIHGTHEEGLLGTPASKGCIRMSNKDVIDLFTKVEVGTFVIILNN